MSKFQFLLFIIITIIRKKKSFANEVKLFLYYFVHSIFIKFHFRYFKFDHKSVYFKTVIIWFSSPSYKIVIKFILTSLDHNIKCDINYLTLRDKFVTTLRMSKTTFLFVPHHLRQFYA